ncbi:MAG: hypothetical protein ABI746_06800 [Dermatophilaceae bacterium]
MDDADELPCGAAPVHGPFAASRTVMLVAVIAPVASAAPNTLTQRPTVKPEAEALTSCVYVVDDVVSTVCGGPVVMAGLGAGDAGEAVDEPDWTRRLRDTGATVNVRPDTVSTVPVSPPRPMPPPPDPPRDSSVGREVRVPPPRPVP